MRTSADSHRLALVFSCLGHVYVHLFAAVYFGIVVALEVNWSRPYHELVGLWTLGALMVGVAALAAGWLGDRWSASGMLVVFFVGMGGCSVLAGLSDSPATLLLTLTGIGTFAAIYHPVGIPWLIRNAGRNKGKAFGFNGIFGSVGTAAAGSTAGLLIDLASWRAAFIVPGVFCLITGLVLWWIVRARGIADTEVHYNVDGEESKRDQVRVCTVLLITMFLAAIVYHSTQSALPKLLELHQDVLLQSVALGVGVLIGAIYTAAGVMQVLGGHLADRFSL